MARKRVSIDHETRSGAGVRRRLEVRGRVQGVGFRPFVYRLARDLELGGLVGNDTHGAFIEIEGPTERVQCFIQRLQTELPPLARITELTTCAIPARQDSVFQIHTSQRAGLQDAEITPDVATCDDCLAELLEPSDRRFRYPFINCTHCGPRYSIIRSVPYDRPNTTMARFRMCPACQAEYDDPANRRFHAQPNACGVCGPRVWLTYGGGHELAGDAIRECARLLRECAIVAIKGIGGFHLACRADDDRVVDELRLRKSREAKPLAVMAASLEAARSFTRISETAAAELQRPERPIVLLPRRDGSPISGQVAPGLDRLGILLPYAPLHHLLFAEGLPALVMTSGNPSEEPLCCDNAEALHRLGHIADAFLLHDRDIERRVDDSVVIALDRPEPGILPIRRARGFAPAPVEIATEAPEPILAVGGELKSTVCLLAGNQAIVSEHLGELSNAEAYRHFVGTIEQLKTLLQTEPTIVACDLHPGYAATRHARKLGLPLVEVQHHHAHVVSCMAENGLSGRVIGLSCDGTGYGTDGAIWGCEVLACSEAEFERVGHLRYFPLLGGDAAAREAWRPAAGLLSQVRSGDFVGMAPEAFARVPAEAITMARQRLSHPKRIPQTSSLGRLFDAVAFLLGICDENRYEAEAAMVLEAAAARYPRSELLNYAIVRDSGPDATISFDVGPAVLELIGRARAGCPAGELARAFHETVATMLSDGANEATRVRGLNRVVLSGGCFANRLLTERVTQLLTAAGREVFVHRQVPPGDGGIALGQAVVAAERARRGMICA